MRLLVLVLLLLLVIRDFRCRATETYRWSFENKHLIIDDIAFEYKIVIPNKLLFFTKKKASCVNVKTAEMDNDYSELEQQTGLATSQTL